MEQLRMDKNDGNMLGNMTSYLFCNISDMDQFSVMAPQGIEKLRNLHMLGVVSVGKNNGVARKLERLTNLQRLGVTCLSEEEGQELCNSIKNLNRLQRLEVHSKSLRFLNNNNIAEVPPKYLVSLRLCGLLDSLPTWIKLLNDLTKVKLLGTKLVQVDIDCLKDLRNLASLGLWEKSYKDNSLHFNGNTFPKLIFLDIDGLEDIETININEAAMPKLQQLWVNKCHKLRINQDGLSGVSHLLNLNELVLKKCGDNEVLVKLLQRQLSTHEKRPKFLRHNAVELPVPVSFGGERDEKAAGKMAAGAAKQGRGAGGCCSRLWFMLVLTATVTILVRHFYDSGLAHGGAAAVVRIESVPHPSYLNRKANPANRHHGGGGGVNNLVPFAAPNRRREAGTQSPGAAVVRFVIRERDREKVETMEATAVSLARSVLDGVLSSVGPAVADEVARFLGVPKEVGFIRNELEMMQAFIKTASSTLHPDAAAGNDIVRTWVKQVRDLAYDVEDCLLDFALYAARTTTTTTSSSSRSNSSWLRLQPGALTARRRIAERIRELKASVEELNQLRLRYNIVVDDHHHRTYHQEHAAMLPNGNDGSGSSDNELAFQESEMIGRESEKEELTRLISDSSGKPTVLSVWGMGGMGKSSLVRMVHNNNPALLDEFDCSAWVTVPHPLDSADDFRRRLSKQLSLGVAAEDDEQSVIRDYLKEKRYIIMVDDLLSQEEWEQIWPVLQLGNDKGSIVIVTTRRKDVAEHCAAGRPPDHKPGLVYELKRLDNDQSKALLCRKVYKTSNYDLLEDMKLHMSRILKGCWGLPLAISTIGGLLSNRPKTGMEWKKLHEHLGVELESDQLQDITKVLASSYHGLTYHLKPIFLYLSIFPENNEIRRTRLLRRWMAEGYIEKNRDMPVELVGERFFNELINRSMI
uniref:NB-ARC domain-containing protein n=2 Tax=Leersia perrieri TaxID=77586 RepID=A0A0D9XKC3_9ORYZ